MGYHMKRIVVGLLALLLPAFASAQVYNKFGPATGVLKGSTSTYQTTAATSADIFGLWSGSCSSSTFLRGDGTCASASISTPVSATNGGTGEAGTITGIPKANSTSPFTAAVSSDVFGLWTGTCDGTTFLRGDGACAAAGGGSAAGSNTQVQYNNSGSFGASADFTWDNSVKLLNVNESTNQLSPGINIVGGSGISHALLGFTDQLGGTSYAVGGIGGVFVLGDFNPGTNTIVRALEVNGSTGTVTSSTLKASSSRALGINSAGQVNLNGSTGTANYVITANGGSPASWSPIALSGLSPIIGGGALTAGQCASDTVSVVGADVGMGIIATPRTYPGDGAVWMAYSNATDSVTVKVCAIVALTPTSSRYDVRVVQ